MATPQPDPDAEANAEGARELAELGVEPAPPEVQREVREAVRKAIASGIYRAQPRPANDDE